MKRINRGFTLIELLVVIAIIGILASVILAALDTARAKARDSERLSDLRQVQTALETYYDDNGTYPSTAATWYANCSSYGSHGTTGAGGYIPNLAPTDIPVLPLDPKPIGTSNCYMYKSNGTDYMFLINGTVEGSIIPSLIRPHSPTDQDYAVYTAGAASW